MTFDASSSSLVIERSSAPASPQWSLSLNWWALALGVLCLADCTKHALSFATGPTVLAADASEYWQHAENAAAGDWWQLNTRADYRTPLYPAFVGLIRRAFPNDTRRVLAIVQHGLQMLTGCATAFICWQIARRRWAVLLGYALSVLCLTRVWYANTVLTEPLFTLLLTAMVGAVAAYHRRPSGRRAATVAVLLGLTTLVRPVPQLLWIPLFALFFVPGAFRRPLRQTLKETLLAAAMLLVVFSPWYVRNWIVFDEPFLTRLPAANKWQVCFQGGSAAGLPIPDNPAGKRLLSLLPQVRHLRGENRHCYAVIHSLEAKQLSDRQIDELVTRVCVAAIQEHPLPFCWATFKRFGNFWRCTVKAYPFYSEYSHGSAGNESQSASWRMERLAAWYEHVLRRTPSSSLRWNAFAAAVAALGTLLLIRRRETRGLGLSLAAIFLYFAAVTAAVELENYRYRMVLEPSLIVATVCGFAVWRGDRASR